MSPFRQLTSTRLLRDSIFTDLIIVFVKPLNSALHGSNILLSNSKQVGLLCVLHMQTSKKAVRLQKSKHKMHSPLYHRSDQNAATAHWRRFQKHGTMKQPKDHMADSDQTSGVKAHALLAIQGPFSQPQRPLEGTKLRV